MDFFDELTRMVQGMGIEYHPGDRVNLLDPKTKKPISVGTVSSVGSDYVFVEGICVPIRKEWIEPE